MDPMIRTGEAAPAFRLPDVHGTKYSLEEARGSIVVLNFWSAECTWCERVDADLAGYLEAWQGTASVWWIASNANENRQLIIEVASRRKLPILLIDDRQQAADLYGAQTTPHFFVVDGQGILAYQGAWDDVTFRHRQPTRTYVPAVIQALANHQAPDITQTPPYGCVLVRAFSGIT